MAVQVQVATLTKPTSGSDGATQDLNLNFTPKAIYVISASHVLSDTSGTIGNHAYYSIGFSDGTNQACVGYATADGTTAGQALMSHRTDSVYCNLDTNALSLTNRASVIFATNKVTFTWDVMDTLSNCNLIVLAFGGADITNVKVGTASIGRTTIGTQDYTGLGFTPTTANSILFTLGAFQTSNNTVSALSEAGCLNRGAALSTSKRWVCGITSEDNVAPSDTWRYYDNAACLKSLNLTGAIDFVADFSTWISDGFRLNYTDAPTSSTTKFSYMVIKGGNWDVGTLQSPTTPTTNVDYTVSVGSNTLRGLLIDTVATATLTTAQTIATSSTGVTDGTNKGCISIVDEDAQATTDCYMLGSTTNLIKPLTTNGATLELATFDSFPSTSAFRLDWATASAAQEYYGWVVVADAPSAQNYPVTISEPSISIGAGSVTRVPTYRLTISDPTISVDQSLARVYGSHRTISDTPTITVGPGTLTGTIGRVRTISDTPAISVNQTISRIYGATRPITDTPSISIDQTISRVQTILREISETQITTSDNLMGSLVYILSIIEPRIKWYYSLMTRKIPEGEV